MSAPQADALRLRATMAAADALRDHAPGSRAVRAQRAAGEGFAEAWAEARAAVERAGAIACAPGCGACCHQHVALLAVEAVAIASTLAADRETTRRRRVAETDARTRSMTAPERRRARIACAFLATDGRCSIYEIRPIRCRGVHSRDAAECRRQTDDPDAAATERAQRVADHPAFPRLPVQLADAALGGLAAAAAERGIARESLELARAVQILLETPDRAAAVMAGVDDLAEARLDLALRPVAAT